MAVATSPSPARSEPVPVTAGGRGRWPLAAAWGGVALLLAVNLPGFLCMGLDGDISMYDLVARRVLAGDTHYRDLLETNFPGIIWVHMAVRSVLGWRSEALRGFDFAAAAASAVLLVGWLPRSTPAWGRVAAAGVLLAFYLSTSEWCHCQRDPWMLLPCLVALRLRAGQSARLSGPTPAPALFGRAAAEGAVWGAAFWIKPFVAVPGLACWLVSARAARRAPGAGRRLAADLAGLLLGGLVVGGLGVGWLVGTGAWPAFVEVMFDWNREYFTFQTVLGPWWVGPLGLVVRFFPWMFVHLAAVPVAAAAVWRGGRGRHPVPPLLAACYLAWLLQTVALQHMFDYVHAPGIMLGVTVLAAYGFGCREAGGGWPALAFLLACVLLSCKSLAAQPGGVWAECVTGGSTPAVRDRMGRLGRIDYTNLDRVAGFLRDQKVGDGEVTCFSLSTISLDNDLRLRPSTRYLFLQDHLNIFRSRRATILAALADSRQRFVVCDLRRNDMRVMREAVARGGRPSPACCRADRIAFRAGDYVVFRVEGREMPAWLDAYFTQAFSSP